jgi:hypothetical protein
LDSTDYTATNGTSVVLASGASLNDEVVIVAFKSFTVADTYTKGEVDAFAVKLTGAQTVAGVKTFSSEPLFSAGIALASGQGINFGASSNAAGMTSETLNDYEEGTWTPTDASGAGLSFTSVTAIYTKVGRLVTCMFSITYPTTASAAQVVIGGFPFTNTSVDALGGGCINYTNAAITNAYFSQASGNTLSYAYTSGASALANSTLSAKILRLTVTYMTS